MTKAEYVEYLKSEHWKTLRLKKRKRVASRNRRRIPRCAVCAAEGKLDTHHLQYRNIYDVLTSDLRLLCRTCHDVAHELINEGVLTNRYSSHHGMFAALKVYVKQRRGLTGRNLFAEVEQHSRTGA